MEMLEGRRLMAVDSQPLHNGLIAEDVNRDFSISPLDALLVINALNRSKGPTGEGESGTAKPYVDVSGDGQLSPLDALLVINALNAEGEGTMIVSYTIQITDAAGAPKTQVVVGEKFTVRVFVQDIRPTIDATGVFSAGLDLDIDANGGETESALVQFPSVSTQTFLQGIRGGSRLNSSKAAERGPDGSDEEFNEVSLLDANTSFPAFRDPPIDPTRIETFFTAEFLALKPGSLSFTPSPADTAQADTLFYGDNAAIPTSSIMFAAPVTLTIISDPTAPVAANDTVATAEDTPINLGNAGLTSNDTVTAPRTLMVTAINTIVGTTVGTVSGLTYTPPLNFNGTDRVTYTVADSTGLTSSATVTINVTPVNDPPVAGADAFPIPGDSTANPLNVLSNDNAGGGETQPLTITLVSVPSNGGTVTVVNGTSLSYTPAVGFEGVETFNYTISDGQATASATVTLTVEPATVPFARRDTASIAEVSAGETGSVKINVLANDKVNPGAGVKGRLISFNQPSNGTVTLDDNGTAADDTDDQLVYVPNFEFNGSDTFTYVMNDTVGTGANSTGTVVVTVTDVNDVPIAGNDNASGTEDTAVTIAISTLLSNDSPGLGETTTQTLSVTPGTSSSGTVSVVGSNVIFTPSAALNGNRTFTYVIADSGTPSLTATGTVTVNLAAVNDAPIAGPDLGSTNEDTELVITVASLLTNDAPGRPAATDETGQTLSITGVAKPAATLGSVSLNAGNITYIPALNFNGVETFTYTLLDSAGATSIGTVTVTVNPINDAPIAGIDSVETSKGLSIQIPVASLLANDVAGPANETGQTPLTITGVSGAVNGMVSLNTNTGIITFTPAADFTGAASFQYTVQDSGPTGGTNVNSGTGTVNVTVRDFVPTDVSGTVWVDETNDGVIDAAERRLGGVEVRLTGSALGVPIAPQTYVTLADGSYRFDDLAPGEYVVRYVTPAYMMDGLDVAGPLGDADNVENQFTIIVAPPGGGSGAGYNFAAIGMEASYGRALDLLASRYFLTNPAMIHKGLYAAVAADNTFLWSAKLDGFDGMVASEVVYSASDNRLILTMVDANQNVFSASLDSRQFVTTTDRDTGNKIFRILGDASSINFVAINRAVPPVVSANRYLEAIDRIFAQEGWDDLL